MEKSGTTPVRVAVVEDHPMMLRGLQVELDALGGYRVVVEAEHGEAYIGATRTQPVDLAVVDLRMPVMDGYQTLAWMRDHQPSVGRVALSWDMHAAVAERALRCGAQAVLSKGVGAHEVGRAMACVLAGGLYRNEWLDAQLLRRAAEAPSAAEQLQAKLARLSPRERECLRMLLLPDELSREAMADRLDLSSHTVNEYVRRLYDKLGVNSRVALVRLMAQHGLPRAR